MTTITIYEPAMCCSTGICSTEIDQRRVDLADDSDCLKAKARCPGRVELADWVGVSDTPASQAPKTSSCCSGAKKMAGSCC